MPLLCIANWKAQLTLDQEVVLADDISKTLLKNPADNVEVVLAPSFLSLHDIARTIDYPLLLAAQDCYWQQPSAATGEITPVALAQVGCKYSIIGHSERRAMGEDNVLVAKKVALLLKTQKKLGITPIVCIGETASERKSGKTYDAIRTQLVSILELPELIHKSTLVIAYEPVWAISTTSNTPNRQQCDPVECNAAGQYIETIIADYFPVVKKRPTIHVIYGGSVNERNAASYITQGGMKGVLVGNASLHKRQYCAIVQALNSVSL